MLPLSIAVSGAVRDHMAPVTTCLLALLARFKFRTSQLKYQLQSLYLALTEM